MPVWCSGLDFFINTYPDAYKTEYIARLGGFGKGYTECDVYKIPKFVIKSDKAQYVVNNLYVAVADYNKIKFDFIISSTMFSKTDYLISNSDNSLSIHFPVGREFMCTPIINQDCFDKITVWAHE